MSKPQRAVLPPIDAVAANAVLIAVRQAAHVLCDRTVLLILLHAQLGACRYADFQARTGLASRLLSGRLAKLHCGGQGVAVEQHCAFCSAPVHARDIGLSVSRRGVERMPAKSMVMRRSKQGLHMAPRGGPTPLAHVLEVLGDKWSIEIVVCAFLRAHLFSDFVAHTGISTNILADRLQRLVNAGLLSRPQCDDRFSKGAYMLTDTGRAFYPVLTAIQAWADTWLSERIRSPVKLRHLPCGHALAPTLVCRHCGESISRENGRLRLAAGQAR